MQCPWCEFEGTDWEEVNFHCLKSHPEKSELENFMENKLSRLWGTAVDLTDIRFGDHKDTLSKEDVMATYRYFLRELMKSEK